MGKEFPRDFRGMLAVSTGGDCRKQMFTFPVSMGMYFPAAFIISFFNICMVWGEQLTLSATRRSFSLSFAILLEVFLFC